jgi:hypothetical protein
MLEGATSLKVPFFVVQLYNFNLILSIFYERAQGESEVPLRLVTEVDGVEREVRFVGIDLFLLRAFLPDSLLVSDLALSSVFPIVGLSH